MKLLSLRTLCSYIEIDDNIRDTNIYNLQNVELTGRNIHYPNCLLKSNNTLINPYDERVMSLNKDSFYDNDEWTDNTLSIISESDHIKLSSESEPSQQPEHTVLKALCALTPHSYIKSPVYFFIYNVDNYYHFIYDSLPILFGYFKLKESIPNIKLLINTSHPTKSTLSQFVIEFLHSLSIDNWLIGKKGVIYENMYIGTSLTHGKKSNETYSMLARNIWNSCFYKSFQISDLRIPKRFYISRRTWIHGKTDNIGTNYTMRRKCVNEDALVEMLKQYNIEEIFTELLTTDEKLLYFKNAELVVGIIGGGMCNLLFSPDETKRLCITTPYFLDINSRFQYSMNNKNIIYSDACSHSEKNKIFTLYSRVRIKSGKYSGCIGEVEKNDDNYEVKLSSNDIAGFSQDFHLETYEFSEDQLEAIDKGLNSPFICDIDKVEADLKLLLKL